MLAVDIDFVKMVHDKNGKVVVETIIDEHTKSFKPPRPWGEEKIRMFMKKLKEQTGALVPGA